MPNTATKSKTSVDSDIQEMFEVGAHYGQSKSRRHPSTIPFIYGMKNRKEIFDLEKTKEALDNALAFVEELGASGKQLLFVTSKHEANEVLRKGAESIDQPFVTGRWIGGTLTNFKNIRGRIEKLQELRKKQESGELEKYTKKEQLLLDREIDRLENKFGGIESMESFPGALFIIDTKEEEIAVAEAQQNDIPIIGVCSTDCNIDIIEYPIPANDAQRASVAYFVEKVVAAYEEGRKKHQPESEVSEEEKAKTMADTENNEE